MQKASEERLLGVIMYNRDTKRCVEVGCTLNIVRKFGVASIITVVGCGADSGADFVVEEEHRFGLGPVVPPGSRLTVVVRYEAHSWLAPPVDSGVRLCCSYCGHSPFE